MKATITLSAQAGPFAGATLPIDIPIPGLGNIAGSLIGLALAGRSLAANLDIDASATSDTLTVSLTFTDNIPFLPADTPIDLSEKIPAWFAEGFAGLFPVGLKDAITVKFS